MKSFIMHGYKGKYIDRLIVPDIREGLKHYPVTAVVGPRQCGKSTLARKLLRTEKPLLYLDLEKPSDLAKLDEPEWFLSTQKDKLICIDEIQRKPELFPLIRSLVDEWDKNGCFLVLGSASRDLLQQSSESLAGRISYKELTPFLWEEVKEITTYEHYLSAGGFPRSLLQKEPVISYQWREDFIATYLERDLLQWKGFSPPTMRRLWQMLAHNNGQTLNYSTIGSSLGVSHTTVRNYVDLLEETFMLQILRPYKHNTTKRLVKSPKVYLSDTGITSALLGLHDFQQLAGHPVFGSLWESMVLTNLKGLFPRAVFSFYRTSHGSEIDIIIEQSGRHITIECKSSLAPTLSRGTHAAIGDISPLYTFIVAPVTESYSKKPGIEVVSLSACIERLRVLFSE